MKINCWTLLVRIIETIAYEIIFPDGSKCTMTHAEAIQLRDSLMTLFPVKKRRRRKSGEKKHGFLEKYHDRLVALVSLEEPLTYDQIAEKMSLTYAKVSYMVGYFVKSGELYRERNNNNEKYKVYRNQENLSFPEMLKLS